MMGWSSALPQLGKPNEAIVEVLEKKQHLPIGVGKSATFDMVAAVFRTYWKDLADARIPISANEDQQRQFELNVFAARERAKFMLQELGVSDVIDFEE